MELNISRYVEDEYKKIKNSSHLKNFREKDTPFVIYQFRDTKDVTPSDKYVGNKKKKMDYLGIPYVHVNYNIGDMDKTLTLKEIEDIMELYKNNPYIIQKPIPSKIEKEILELETKTLSPDLDVEGLRLLNVGKLNYYHTKNKPLPIPCTARGIAEYMHFMGDLKGKEVLIINRSELIGKPLFKLLLDLDMGVTIMHSKIDKSTIINRIKDVDYLIIGVGCPNFLKSTDLKGEKPLTIIDAGINVSNGKIIGDYTPMDSSKEIYHTPVPRGVGQLTVLSLVKNILGIDYLK